MHKSKILDFFRVPILAAFVMLITLFASLIKLPIIIPPFIATLFMIFLNEGSEFAQFKNVLGGHLIAVVCSFIPLLTSLYFLTYPTFFKVALTVGIAILISGWLMTFLNVQHPPAAATVLLFLNLDVASQSYFQMLPLSSFISFCIGLILISFIAWLFVDKPRKSSTGHFN
ncbi:MAG: HPP family protein [Candidatus Woesearchaeota archaeon]